MIILIFTGIIFVLFIGLTFLVVGTLNKKGKMGINTAKVNCPMCGNPMPAVRAPKNLRQFLWGGGTCSSCGCEMDKWGKQI
jgi:hypothetical protein